MIDWLILLARERLYVLFLVHVGSVRGCNAKLCAERGFYISLVFCLVLPRPFNLLSGEICEKELMLYVETVPEKHLVKCAALGRLLYSSEAALCVLLCVI